MLTKADIILK